MAVRVKEKLSGRSPKGRKWYGAEIRRCARIDAQLCLTKFARSSVPEHPPRALLRPTHRPLLGELGKLKCSLERFIVMSSS